jgi:hypothetical protein
MSDVFDVFSQHGAGTVVLSRMLNLRPGGALPAPGIDVGVVNVPAPGETLCGDGWHQMPGERGISLLVADGLGHGPFAHDAARCAIEVCRHNQGRAPAELMAALHVAARRCTKCPLAEAAVTELARDGVWLVPSLACAT